MIIITFIILDITTMNNNRKETDNKIKEICGRGGREWAYTLSKDDLPEHLTV